MSKRTSKSTIGPIELTTGLSSATRRARRQVAAYQRRVLEMALRRRSGELAFRLVVLSEPKKSDKTLMAACLALCGR